VSDESRSILHVLPHPGGGGETYVDALERMDGYRFTRMFLARAPRGSGTISSVALSGVRIPVAARHHDVLHVHGEVAGVVCLPSLAMRPSVVTLHGLNLVRRLRGVSRAVAEANLRLIVRVAGRTICVSEAEGADVVAVVGRRSAGRVIVIQNGVVPLPAIEPAERAGARARLGLPDDAITAVWVGTLDDHKDPVVAARAATDVAREGSSFALLMLGDGPLRPELDEVARDSGGVLQVLGHRQDVREVLVAADFFVLSSRREGLSYALLEAMSLGLPGVVSDAPGNSEAVGDSGIVVPRGDVGGFAAGFKRLLAQEPERLAFGRRARERVARHFNAEDMVRRTRDVYADLAGRRNAG
jgi:glycosyltransferase involved in cell wall biosynthesis